jgi:hypothetical protein
MSTQNEQAALLAEQSAYALAGARKSFINAADVADDVDSDLRRCENEIYELPNQAMLALRNTDKSKRHLRIANRSERPKRRDGGTGPTRGATRGFRRGPAECYRRRAGGAPSWRWRPGPP